MSTDIPSSISETENVPPEGQQESSVIFGSQNYILTLFRAIHGELFKINRRVLSTVLTIIGIATVAVCELGIFLLALINNSSSSQTGQMLAEELANFLHLPGVLTFSGSVIGFIVTILLIILAGTIVGGEYAAGTIRVMLTRGPSRTQYLLAKFGAALLYTLALTIGLLIIAIAFGTILNLFLHQPVDISTMNGAWIGHAVLYILTLILSIFFYAVLAIFLATLGKSTAAGIAGGLAWWLLESVVSSILTALGNISTGSLGSFLKAVPDYLPRNNLSALIDNQAAYMSQSQAGTLTDVHAILVVVIYLVVFIGISFWVQESRDVTN